MAGYDIRMMPPGCCSSTFRINCTKASVVSTSHAQRAYLADWLNEAYLQIELKTAPADYCFPTTNQSRHCFTRYIEFHRYYSGLWRYIRKDLYGNIVLVWIGLCSCWVVFLLLFLFLFLFLLQL